MAPCVAHPTAIPATDAFQAASRLTVQSATFTRHWMPSAVPTGGPASAPECGPAVQNGHDAWVFRAYRPSLQWSPVPPAWHDPCEVTRQEVRTNDPLRVPRRFPFDDARRSVRA